MTTDDAQGTTPTAMHQLSPHLVCAGAAEAIDFYVEAFGATEMMRMPGPDGRLMHASLTINGSSVLLVDEMLEHGVKSPKTLGGTPVTIHLVVPDADAFVERAVAAGATVTMPLEDAFWGDRYGVIEDPFGHSWSVSTPIKEMSRDEIRTAAEAATE